MSTSVEGTKNSNILYIPDALLCITLIEIKHSTSTKLLKADRGRQIYAMIFLDISNRIEQNRKTRPHFFVRRVLLSNTKKIDFNQKNFQRRYNGFSANLMLHGWGIRVKNQNCPFRLVHLYFLCYSKNEHHTIIFTYFPRMRIIQTPRKGTLFMVFRFNMTITFLHIFRELE